MTDAERVQGTKFPDPADRTPTILIVDDEPLIRMGLSDFLQECGFKVLEGSNAAEALQMIKSHAVVIDLVITDVRMPGDMDGFGLAQWVRTNQPALPVILCSGDAKKAEIAQDVCADQPFFRKPYDLQLMVAKIRQALHIRKTGD